MLPNAMLGLFIYVAGWLGTLLLIAGGVIYVLVSLIDHRPCPIRVPAAMLCGFIAGAGFIWMLMPHDWPLPLWTTLAASVNAEKYGHPVEHSAEGIVVWMMFGAVVGAVVGGFASRGLTTREWRGLADARRCG